MTAWDAHLGGDPAPEMVKPPEFSTELLEAARAAVRGRRLTAIVHRAPHNAERDAEILTALLYEDRNAVVLFPSHASALATFDRVRRTLETLAEN